VTIIEKFTEGGYTATLYHDEDCSNPREDDEGKFLFLGFPHRSYEIGDEVLDPERYEARTLDELIEAVRQEYKARLVRPVHMIDHSGVCYRLGQDSGTCGLMVATNEALEIRGGKEWAATITDEQLEEWMAGEIDEYSKWANGECYGYVTRDVNGVEVDSCWGLIGYECAEEEAKQSLKDLPLVERKYLVGLTVDEMRSLLNFTDDGQRPEIHTARAAIVEALHEAKEEA
jgi:hypothetical protein